MEPNSCLMIYAFRLDTNIDKLFMVFCSDFVLSTLIKNIFIESYNSMIRATDSQCTSIFSDVFNNVFEFDHS